MTETMNEADEATYKSIDIMLHPKSVCVIGATQRMSYGGRFLNNLIETKFKGNVYPINPRYKEIMGVPCYPDVASLPETPDLAGIIVPYENTKEVLEDCAKKGVKTGVIITGQFAELQTDDRRDAQQWLKDFALHTGMRLCGPNCLGIANVKDNIWPSSANMRDIKNTIPGELALISQSGASAFGPFLLRAQDRGIGYDYILSTFPPATKPTSKPPISFATVLSSRILKPSLPTSKPSRTATSSARWRPKRSTWVNRSWR